MEEVSLLDKGVSVLLLKQTVPSTLLKSFESLHCMARALLFNHEPFRPLL